jgi:hypothetical protein
MTYAIAFMEALPHKAKQLGIPLEVAYAAAEESGPHCAICVGPLVDPAFYPSRPKCVLCGPCRAALEEIDYDFKALKKHPRFRSTVRNRGRLLRAVAMNPNKWAGKVQGKARCNCKLRVAIGLMLNGERHCSLG